MKTTLVLIFVSILTVSIINSSCQKQVDYSNDIGSLKESVAALQITAETLTNELSIADANITGLSTGLDSIKNQISNIQLEVNKLESEINSTTGNFNAINAQILLINQQYTSLLTQINEIISQLAVTPNTILQGLIAYYPFNGDANDASGNGNNGIVNGAILTSDRFGNENASYSFNGVNSYISINNSASLSNVTSISIAVWCNVNQWFISGTSGWFPIISKSDQQMEYGIYRLGLTNQKGYPEFYGNLNNGVIGDANLSNSFTLNQWEFVVITISNGIANIYYNGVFINSSATVPTGWPTYPNLPLIIGLDKPGTSDFANGKIDDLRIYNRVLSQQEITYLYNTDN